MRGARHLPNAITVLRLVCVPAMVWMLAKAELGSAFWLFLLAGVSDAVDGAAARLLRANSVLGSYLDALADKVLLVSVYAALGLLGLLWGWLVAMVVCRDLLLIGFAAFMHLSGTQTELTPLRVSKVNTLAQIVLAAVVLGHQGMKLFPAELVPPLSWLVAATTAGSAVAYAIAWSRRPIGLKNEGAGE